MQLGIPANITVGSVVRLEAEEAILKGAPTASRNAGHSGSGYVDFKAKSGESIQWNVNIEAEGKYILQFKYAVAGGERPLKVELNGKTVAEKGDFSDSGGWESWKHLDFPVTLKKGKNEIRLTSIGFSGPNVDYLSLVNLDIKKDNSKLTPPKTQKPLTPDHLLLEKKWYHILVNFENDKANVYVNSKLIEASPLSAEKLQPKGRFHIGPNSSGSPYLMDEVRLYSRSLSQAEIEELFRR